MKILVEQIEDITVIHVDGRLDTLTAPSLQAVVKEHIENKRTNIIFNLEHTKYVSSTGFRVFIIALKKVKPVGGQIILVGVNTDIKEIFDISGFTHLFVFGESIENALELF